MLVELVVTTSERADSLYLTQWTEPLRNLCGERLDSHFVYAPWLQIATMRGSQVGVGMNSMSRGECVKRFEQSDGMDTVL